MKDTKLKGDPLVNRTYKLRIGAHVSKVKSDAKKLTKMEGIEITESEVVRRSILSFKI